MPNLPAEPETQNLTRHHSGPPEKALCCVIGSGPAGVACAKALLDRGKRVRMLDAGVTLEPDRLSLVQRFKAGSPQDWTAADLAAYKTGMNPDVGGVPLKLVYGSDFAYREADKHLGTDYGEIGLRPSFAKGGLSNVWGAAMLPFAERDMKEWPLPVAALAEHYAAALQLTGLAASHDSLEDFFPLYTKNLTTLDPSRQGRQLLETMETHRGALAGAGIHFGRSRLAVRGTGSAQPGCVYCRLCMYGCPYGYIYNSSDTLAQLQTEPRFNYQPGVVVSSVRETAEGVEISGYDRLTRQPLVWQCERAFLAAGAIATTRILLRSLEAYDQTVCLKDSQYFLLPLLMLRKVKGATREWLHALSQIFLELFDAKGQDTTAHIQIYSNSDLISQAVAQAFGPLQRPLRPVVRNLQERMLVAQGFLHSQHSSRVEVCLRKGDGKAEERLELRAGLNPLAPTEVRRVVRMLSKNGRRIGVMPMPLMLKIAEPGRSFHCGGSFPMSTEPRGFQTDLLGRLSGWRRIHAVDATVFPSVPATTITLSVMANAHRIGWQSADLA